MDECKIYRILSPCSYTVYLMYEHGCAFFYRLSLQIGGHILQNRIEMAFHLK